MKRNLKTKFILLLMIGGIFVFPLLSIDYFSSNNSINDVNFEFDGKNQLKSSLYPPYDWSEVITIKIGNDPRSVFVGDANNDGYNDIVAANSDDDAYNDDVSIILWNATIDNWDPEFRRGVRNHPSSVYIGDANNDGYNDIVTANFWSDDFSIRLWNPISGDWDTHIRKTAGSGTHSVFVGDANNDGYNDLVASNWWSHDVSIRLWNDTSGDWDTHIRVSVGLAPLGVSMGDANNDGYNDILTANTDSNSVSIIQWNSTSGGWDPTRNIWIGGSPQFVSVGDINNDGYNDIAAAKQGVNRIGILLWNTTIGDWNPPFNRNVGNSPRSVSIGDANNDGYNDMVAANSGSDDVSIYLWNVTLGDWNPQIRRSAGNGAWSVVIGDANNDGYNDIVIANYLSDDITIRLWSFPCIKILTPKNTFYRKALEGVYPATFGFDDDAIGESQPKRFNNSYSTSCSGEVISELDGHKKAFSAYDNNNGGSAIVMQRFNEGGFQNQTHGTIEFWFRVGSINVNTEIRLNWGYGVNDASIVLRLSSSGQWQHNNGTWNQLPNISNPLPNTWYHIKIHFRCQAAPSYLGLNENHYEVIIDGVSSGSLPFSTLTTEIAMFMPIYTAWGPYGGNYAYCDAIGYSWDSAYDVGDNLNEGMRLSFENNTILDWIAYSLDGQDNKTIFEQEIMPMPEDGTHTIQIFGRDAESREILESEIRYFTIDTTYPEIIIHSPGDGETFGYIAPKYNISIIEKNLDSMWYTIDGGVTNYSISKLNGFIDQYAWIDAPLGPITIGFYGKDLANNTNYKEVVITKGRLLSIDIINQSFSLSEFTIEFAINNESYEAIDFASIQMWWNGVDVSADIQNLGNGLYFISLDPITVAPGDDPILLNMTISAIGYEEKYFETYIAVDPEILQKGDGKVSEELPLPLIITISVVSAGAVIGLASIFWYRRKKREV